MKNTLKSALVVFILFSTVTSCKKEEPGPTPPIEYETAEFSTRNYLTADLSLDWLINDAKIISGLAYTFGGKSDFQWEVGSPNVKFSINDASDGTQFFATGLTVVKDKTYYAATIGPASAGVVVLAENDKTQPATGNVRFRLLHAYQDVGPIDLYIGGTTADHKVIDSLEFSQFSPYVEVSHTDISTMIVCTETGILPNPDTNLLTILENTAHDVNTIYLNALASVNTDPASDFKLFVTPQ